MLPKGVSTKVGDVLAFSDLRGFTEATKEIWRRELRAKGVVIGLDDEVVLERRRAELEEGLRRDFRDRGVAPHLKELLSASTKKAVVRVARQAAVTHQEFVDLIFSADHLGLTHRRKHLQFMPDHLRLRDADGDAFFGNGAGPMSEGATRAFRKVTAAFDQRKIQSVHMFEDDSGWHCFYLTYSDTYVPAELNHWKCGPHLHYLSHLFTTLDAEAVWEAFDDRKVSLPGVHIRFVEDGS